MASLAETTGSLGKSLNFYIKKQELSPFGHQFYKNLIMLFKALLKIRDCLFFRQSLIRYICDQIDCREIFSKKIAKRVSCNHA